MSFFLSYEEISRICNKINECFLPSEDSFLDKMDLALENIEEGLTPKEFISLAFKTALTQVDTEINVIEEKAQIRATCQKGCAHCCYFPIIITPLETKLILQHIDTLEENSKKKIYSHLTTYFSENENQINKLCSINFQKETAFKMTYIAEQLPCPFLDTASNSCMIYDVRPNPCRTYLNYSDPKVCSEAFIPKEPFSYHFLEDFYITFLHSLIQFVIEEGYEEASIFQYPEDLTKYDYMPNLLKMELGLSSPEER